MSWTLSSASSQVTLPLMPTRVSKRTSKQTLKQTLYDTAPFLFAFGAEPRVLTLEGKLAKKDRTTEQIAASFVNKLDAMCESVESVNVGGPGTLYDGVYHVQRFDSDELPGEPNCFKYRLDLWKYVPP